MRLRMSLGKCDDCANLGCKFKGYVDVIDCDIYEKKDNADNN